MNSIVKSHIKSLIHAYILHTYARTCVHTYVHMCDYQIRALCVNVSKIIKQMPA